MSTLDFFHHVIKSQWFTTLPAQTATFEGQTAIITGANTGLGLAAAKYMTMNKAAKVIIACRDATKGDNAKRQLESETGRVGVVELWQLDLASYPSIKKFADRANELERLDVVICSAGIIGIKFSAINHYESHIAINVVSTFLVSLLLLPKLKQTAEHHPESLRHLCIVTSDTHMNVTLDKFHRRKDELIFDQFKNKKRVSMPNQYPLSKLLNLLVTFQLASHVGPDYPVVINTVNPGLCKSELIRFAPSLVMRIINFVLNARTTDEGVRNYIYAVSAGRELHGKYISDCQEAQVGRGAVGEKADAASARIWKELVDILEKIEPGVMSKL